MPKKAPSKRDGRPSGDAAITDPRFANFQTDPRFRLPSRNRSKTTLDKRFAHALHDNDFTATARVDRYGRKIRSDTKKKALQRLYRQEGDEEDEDADEDGADDDAAVRRELGAANAKYDPARGGGFSSSESESESEDEAPEDAEGGGGVALPLQADVELGEVTRRLAVVNLDWDHVKSVDLMSLFSSFAPTGGRVEKVSVYPSQFGKERMDREEMEGPPKDIFRKAASGEDAHEENDKSDSESNDSDVDSDEEIRKELIKEGGDEDFDSNALRSYQLERLRYYYAVVVCSDLKTAQTIYEATDGTEYLSSSNFMDLRFIPDEVGFDEDEPRDECDSVPTGYRPLEFVTDALQSSKVKLTWDMDPDESTRKESIRKAFTGSRAEIAENDLNAYLASYSDGEEEVASAEENGEEAPLSKKELARRKMREALGLSNDAKEKKASKSEGAGEMEITFTPALMGDDDSKKKKKREEGEDETTIEKYMRKERERKEKKRESHQAKRNGAEEADAETDPRPEGDAKEDLGFDDPFFTTQPDKPSKSANRKEERRKKREAREAAAAESTAQKAQLELIMADNTDGKAAEHLDHFDMKDIIRAEKQKRKKAKHKGKKKDVPDQGGLQEEFNMDVEDPRFKAVFEDHEFAIDPSNPKFKATEGMKKLLEKGRKRKQREGDGAEDGGARKAKASRL